MKDLMEIRTIDDIARANREAGKHWFDKGTMRYFNSRISKKIYHDEIDERLTWFISSERYDEDSDRLYSIRIFNRESKAIDTFSEFQEYESRQEAFKALEDAIATPMNQRTGRLWGI